MLDLEKLKALCAQVTPGPWVHVDNDFYWDQVFANLEDRTVTICVVDEGDERNEDFDFIAAAREALPQLISELEAAQSDVKKLKRELDAANDEQDFNPRAAKLLRLRRPFLVISIGENYFVDVYETIRKSEIAKGTWSEYDEEQFNLLVIEHHDAALQARKEK